MAPYLVFIILCFWNKYTLTINALKIYLLRCYSNFFKGVRSQMTKILLDRIIFCIGDFQL